MAPLSLTHDRDLIGWKEIREKRTGLTVDGENDGQSKEKNARAINYN